MEFRGGNNQVGSSNSQFVESTFVTNNHHNHISISIQMNCSDCKQHQHQGVPISQGNEHQWLDLVQRTLASGTQAAQVKVESTTQPQGEAPVKSQIEPATPAKGKVVKKRMVKVPGPGHQTLEQSLTVTSAGTDSVRILDSDGEVLEPGDAVVNGSVWSLYVGDGYIVRYQQESGTVVKKKLDLTKPFCLEKAFPWGNPEVYSPTQRVQRAMQQVGRECPVQGGGGDLDFVCWTHTDLCWEQVECVRRIFDIILFRDMTTAADKPEDPGFSGELDPIQHSVQIIFLILAFGLFCNYC